jgi:hypothetical protein
VEVQIVHSCPFTGRLPAIFERVRIFEKVQRGFLNGLSGLVLRSIIRPRKGLITKQEVLDAIQELRRKTPKAQAVQQPFPEPYLSTETSDALINNIFNLFNATGLTAHQAKDLLGRMRLLIDLGERIGPKTTH